MQFREGTDILEYIGGLGDANPTCPAGQVFASWLAQCIPVSASAWQGWPQPGALGGRIVVADRLETGTVPSSVLAVNGITPPTCAILAIPGSNLRICTRADDVAFVNLKAEHNKPPSAEALAAWRAQIDYFRSRATSPGDVNDQTAALIENGQVPYANFYTVEPLSPTNDSRWSISFQRWGKYLTRTLTSGDQAVVVYKNPGYLIGDVVGVGPSLLEWIALAFPPLGLTWIVVDNLLLPLTQALWDEIKNFACNALGLAAAEAAAQAAGLPAGSGSAALNIACGGNILQPGGSSGDTGWIPWAVGGGALLLAGLAFVAVRRKKGS